MIPKLSPRLILVGITILALVAPTPARAGTFLIADRAGVNATDSVDWGPLGPAFSIVPNAFTITSAGGNSLIVSQIAGPFERRDQGFPSGGWNGNFALGDHLLWTHGSPGFGSSGPITINFGPTGIFAGGAQIQANVADGSKFTAHLKAFDKFGALLGEVTEDGLANNAADNSAIFIGMGSDDTPISKLEFSLDSANSLLGDFAINRLDFAPVPEPASLALFAAGTLSMVAYALRARTRRRSSAGRG
jgi:PEP-CTERM motif